jgi:hypothetical protein
MSRIEYVERFRAWLGGYFWLPCPNCGRMFGGHESMRGEILWNGDDWSRGLVTCPHPACRAQVRRLNEQRQPASEQIKPAGNQVFPSDRRSN